MASITDRSPRTPQTPPPDTHTLPQTRLLRFALPHPRQTAGLPLASCIMVQGPPHDIDPSTSTTVARPYTPVSSPDMQGAFELLVKTYPQGRVSRYLHSLQAGDAVKVKGPFSKLAYTPNMTRRILMLAGGTGLAPMVQLLHRVLDPRTGDETRVTLLLGNRSRKDVLMEVGRCALCVLCVEGVGESVCGIVAWACVRPFRPSPLPDITLNTHRWFVGVRQEWLEARAQEHGNDRFKVVHVVQESDGARSLTVMVVIVMF